MAQAAAQASNANPNKFVMSSKFKTFCISAIALGVLFFVIGMIQNQERAWHAYLVPLFYFSSIAIGGLFFTALQHLTKAGWSVNVRRISESFTSFLPITLIGSLVLLVAGKHLFPWMDSHVVETDHLVQHKVGYLNIPFFVIRVVLFVGGWLWFKKKIVGGSIEQDTSGDHAITRRQTPLSIAFIMFFALSYSFFAVDLLMSLEPHWFSTIFGVYAFAGLFQTTMASMILIAIWLVNTGYLKGFVNENHFHDLGKYMFAFTVFWAYIAFSQFMLIWYANMPEETMFYMPRVVGSWGWVSVALILFKFIVPFVALLSRRAKRNPGYLAALAVWTLVFQYVDIYWLVYPNFNSEKTVFGLVEIFVFIGFLGAFALMVARFLAKHPLVPLKDPFRHESNAHHVSY